MCHWSTKRNHGHLSLPWNLLLHIGCFLLVVGVVVASGRYTPTAATPPTVLQESSLIPAKVPAIVLPEPAFLEAMASGHFQVDRNTTQKAVRLAAQANSPGTLGAMISLDDAGGPRPFAGTIFLVVRDPVDFKPGVRLTIRDYYVAAVELSGQSPWLASLASFMVDVARTSTASMVGSCCGPTTVCVPDSPTPGGCEPDELCTGPGIGVTETFPNGPGWQRNAAAPPVPLRVFQSGAGNLQNLVFGGSCTDRIINRSCGIAKVNCEPNDPGFVTTTGGADIDVGSACLATTRPVNGREIPEWCKYAYFDSPNAPECRGAPFEDMSKSSVSLSEDFVPPMCDIARVTQDSNICTTAREKQQLKALEEVALRLSFGLMGGSRCEPTGRTVKTGEGRWGLNECSECEPGLTGRCRRWVQLTPIDATESDDEPAEGTASGKKQVEDFGPEWVTVYISRTERQKENEASATTVIRNFDPDPPGHQGRNGGNLQSPDPDKPKPPSGSNTAGTQDINRSTGRRDGKQADPILLGDGSFDLSQTDLSFPGPVRALEFTRSYNSRSDDRGTLGSNWVHNWDIWLEPLNVHNTPTWAMPYCLGADDGLVPRVGSDPPGTEPRTTCIVLHRGDVSQLFSLDLGTYLFMPQAGSSDTITSTVDGGWALRSSDGEILRFNPEGFLLEQRDRFGNGFHLEYEPTPLWELYTYSCSPAQLQQRNETKHGRRCAFLAYLVGDGPATSGLPGWQITSADYPLPGDLPRPLPGDLARRPRLDYAVSYFLYLNGRGPEILPPYGTRRMRVRRVTDDLGRSLVFSYARAPRCTRPLLCAGGARYDFVGTPQAELLETVTGPGGATLRFSYASATQTPVDFLETFLTEVVRNDVGGAADVVRAAQRSFTYHYQWPDGPVASFGGFAQKVYDTYREFYATFVGCGFVPLSPCGERGRPQVAFGNSRRLARIAQYAYISDVIDNIIRVDDTPLQSRIPVGGRFPSIQSETRYETDPWSLSFDRAYAQRYGSALAQQDASRIEADRPGDNWASSLPKATFSYVPARLAGLPRQILDHYPLESQPATESRIDIPPVSGANGASKATSCNYSRMEQLRKTLPGWTPPIEYFDAPATTARPNLPLASTPLSCEQLSAATYGDPTHNDLMSSLDPVKNTPELFDHVVRRIVGRRPTTAANGNRICAWTQMRDRDGDLHVYGMNFRGQILVNAVEERPAAGQASSGTFLYDEVLYNADGMPTQRRRTVRGMHRWQPSDGYERLTYDEIDPTGSRGWNEWLPAFWARRLNLLRLEVHPRSGEVIDADENTNTLQRSAGRYQTFAYEPLFNQLKKSESGSLIRNTNNAGSVVLSDVPHERTTVVFDYQELSPLAGAPPDRSLKPVLDSLRGWGFGWTTTKTGEYDLAEITTWQLPLAFYNSDLNGDGVIGFGSGTGAGRLARGVPITIMREGNSTAVAPQLRLFAWAPHGQPAAIAGLDGELMLLDYYSRQPQGANTGFGGTAPPTDADVNGDRAGLLGRIRVLRFSPYSTGTGPGTGCPLLAGPYQALLPPTCSNPPAELERLGLPKQAVNAVLVAARAAQSPSDPERYETTSFSYNTTGHVRYRWSEAREFHYMRDTDGRVVRKTDPVGTTVETQYTTRGFPEQTVIADATGQRLAETRRGFDANGSVVFECVATTAGGCSSTPPVGAVRTFSYWPEGALREAVDPGGLTSTFTYDEQGLLVSEGHHNPAFPADIPMRTRYLYDNDGNLRAAMYAAGRPEQLTETFVYDGLQRLVTYTDTRGFAWQNAYTSRDMLARRKRDDVGYVPGSPGPSAWETELSYDSFNYLVRQQHNGIETLRLRRTIGGRVFAHSATGVGQTVATFDRTGRPAWMRDPAGTVTVFTHLTAGTERTKTSILSSGQQQLTTAEIVQLNAAGQPTKQVDYGSGREKLTSWIPDGLGRITSETNGEGVVTRWHYNLAGLLHKTEQQRSAGVNPQFDVTEYSHNARGQIIRVTDPAIQVTEFDYDGFGRLKERRSPGQPGVVAGFTYDGLGRVDIETLGSNRIRHIYDNRGDPTEDWWFVRPSPMLIGERTFDDLGRIRTSRNTNPALASVAPAKRTVEQELTYDTLGRVATESLRVGQLAAHTVETDWSVAPGGQWERILSYELGGSLVEWLERYDSARRLTQLLSSSGLTTQFSWLGDRYSGRDQQQAGWQSLFRERLSFDPFGQPTGWRYTAIDLDSNRRPLSAQDATRYCGGAWSDTECSRPLLASDALRDAMGRIVSLQSSFGHPVFVGGALTPRTPPQPWRGFGYDPMGRLVDLWEHAGVGATVSTQGLATHTVQPVDIQRIGKPADLVMYQRETAVGGPLSIRNSITGDERFSLPSPRGPGHQLQQVRVDRVTRAVRHDSAGRIQDNGGLEFSFDPRGQLAAVSRNGRIVESYFYDVTGRLAAVGGPATEPPNQVFAYDGLQMVAAFTPTNQALWEAVWGPGRDRLMLWRDLAGGIEHIVMADYRNSVAATWDPTAGRLTETINYDPEGRVELRNPSGALVCAERGTGNICPGVGRMPFAFGSLWRSAATGLVYMRNRWYSPELTQFISPDPLGYIDSYNPYAFASFDPINGWDPLGLDTKCLAGPEACSKDKKQDKKQQIVFRIVGRYDADTGAPIKPFIEDEKLRIQKEIATVGATTGTEEALNAGLPGAVSRAPSLLNRLKNWLSRLFKPKPPVITPGNVPPGPISPPAPRVVQNPSQLPPPREGTVRVYRGTRNPHSPQVAHEYKGNPEAAPRGDQVFLTEQEAQLFQKGTETSVPGVSSTTHFPTAQHPTFTGPKGGVVAYDVPKTVWEQLPTGEIAQGEKVFLGSIPESYRVGTVIKH